MPAVCFMNTDNLWCQEFCYQWTSHVALRSCDTVEDSIRRHLKTFFYLALLIISNITDMQGCLQCFDTVGWASGRASGP